MTRPPAFAEMMRATAAAPTSYYYRLGAGIS